MSRSTVYGDNNGTIFVGKFPRITPTSKHIDIKYNCFRQQVGREFLIQNIESDNHKADIFTRGLHGEFFQD